MTRSAWTLGAALIAAACSSTPPAPPIAIRDDLLQGFRRTASADEMQRFEALRTSSIPAERDSALELVLFPLPDDRLYALGITSVDQSGRKDWAIAWTEDRGPKFEAVDHVLRDGGFVSGAFCDLGFCGWYVPREKFFRARRALLADADVARLQVNVVTPRVAPEQED